MDLTDVHQILAGGPLSWEDFKVEIVKKDPDVCSSSFIEEFLQATPDGFLYSPDFISLSKPKQTALVKLQFIVVVNNRLGRGKLSTTSYLFNVFSTDFEGLWFGSTPQQLFKSLQRRPELFHLPPDASEGDDVKPSSKTLSFDWFFQEEAIAEASLLHKLKYFLNLSGGSCRTSTVLEFARNLLTGTKKALFSTDRDMLMERVTAAKDVFQVEGNRLSLCQPCCWSEELRSDVQFIKSTCTAGTNVAYSRRENIPLNDHIELAKKILKSQGEPISWRSFIMEFEEHHPVVDHQRFQDAFCMSVVPGLMCTRDFICLDTPWNTGLLKLELIVTAIEEEKQGAFSRSCHCFQGSASKEERALFGTNKDKLAESISDLPKIFILSADRSTISLRPDAAARHEFFFRWEGNEKESACHKLKYFLFLCHGKTTLPSAREFVFGAMRKDEKAYLSVDAPGRFSELPEGLQGTFQIADDDVALRNSCYSEDKVRVFEPVQLPECCITACSGEISASQTDDIELAKKILASKRLPALSWKSFIHEFEKHQPIHAAHQSFQCFTVSGLLSSQDFIALDTPWNRGLLKLEVIVMANMNINQGEFRQSGQYFLSTAPKEEKDLLGNDKLNLAKTICDLSEIFTFATDQSTVALKPSAAARHKVFFSCEDDTKTSAVHKLKYLLFLSEGKTTIKRAYFLICNVLTKEEAKYLTNGTKDGFAKVLKALPDIFHFTKDDVSLTIISNHFGEDEAVCMSAAELSADAAAPKTPTPTKENSKVTTTTAKTSNLPDPPADVPHVSKEFVTTVGGTSLTWQLPNYPGNSKDSELPSSKSASELEEKEETKKKESTSSDGNRAKNSPTSGNGLSPSIATSCLNAKMPMKQKSESTDKSHMRNLPAGDEEVASLTQPGYEKEANIPGVETCRGTTVNGQIFSPSFGYLSSYSSLSSSLGVLESELAPERKTGPSGEPDVPVREDGYRISVILQFIKDDAMLALIVTSIQDSERPIISVTCCNDCMVVLHLSGSGFIVHVPETGFGGSEGDMSAMWSTLWNFFQNPEVVVVTFDCETTGRFFLERLDLQLFTVFDVKTALEIISSQPAEDKVPWSSVSELADNLGLASPVDQRIIGEMRVWDGEECFWLDEEQIRTSVRGAALLVPGIYTSVSAKLNRLGAMNELHLRTKGKLQSLYMGDVDGLIRSHADKLGRSECSQITNGGSNSTIGSAESSITNQDGYPSRTSCIETSSSSRSSTAVTQNSGTTDGSDPRSGPPLEEDVSYFSPTDNLRGVPSSLLAWTNMSSLPPSRGNGSIQNLEDGSIQNDAESSSVSESHSSMKMPLHSVQDFSSLSPYNGIFPVGDFPSELSDCYGSTNSVDRHPEDNWFRNSVNEQPGASPGNGIVGDENALLTLCKESLVGDSPLELSDCCSSTNSVEHPEENWFRSRVNEQQGASPGKGIVGDDHAVLTLCEEGPVGDSPSELLDNYDGTNSVEHPEGNWFTGSISGQPEASPGDPSSVRHEDGVLMLCKAEEGDITQVPLEEAGNYESNLSGLTEEVLQDYSAKNTESIVELLRLLGDDITETLGQHLRVRGNSGKLTEMTLDVGRLAEARFHQSSKSEKPNVVVASSNTITKEDLKRVEENEVLTGFDDDDRCGIEGTLHSIRGLRNKKRKLVGLTIRIGLPLLGGADMVYDLALSGKSTLILGYRGVGKTTLLRELARCLSDNEKKRVVVIDTYNEIAGDDDIPHYSIGSSRRLQVDKPENQPAILLEFARNHSPEVIIVDQIESREDVRAVTRLSRSGIQIISGTNRESIKSLLSDESLSQVFQQDRGTLDDSQSLDSAGSLARSKLNPVFEAIVEMKGGDCWYIYDPIHTYSALSEGQSYCVQERRRVWTSGTRSEQQILLKERVIQV